MFAISECLEYEDSLWVFDGGGASLDFYLNEYGNFIYHTINRAAFVCLSVCLSVCSPTPPRSFDGSSPNLVGVCRWTSELPLRGSFLKRSTGQRVTFSDTILYMIADDTRVTPHRCKKHTAYDSRRHQAEATPLQKAHGVFCTLDGYMYLLVYSNSLTAENEIVQIESQ